MPTVLNGDYVKFDAIVTESAEGASYRDSWPLRVVVAYLAVAMQRGEAFSMVRYLEIRGVAAFYALPLLR